VARHLLLLLLLLPFSVAANLTQISALFFQLERQIYTFSIPGFLPHKNIGNKQQWLAADGSRACHGCIGRRIKSAFSLPFPPSTAGHSLFSLSTFFQGAPPLSPFPKESFPAKVQAMRESNAAG
jgi:hypothetical protein